MLEKLFREITLIKLLSLFCILLLFSCSIQTEYVLLEYYKTKGNVDTLIATSNCYFNNLDISNYRLEIIPGNSSRFNTKSNTVLLSKNHIKRENRTIAHEVCHLNMAKFTLNANILENNRFWDEGFANIFAYQVIEELEKYKNRSIQISIQQFFSSSLLPAICYIDDCLIKHTHPLFLNLTNL